MVDAPDTAYALQAKKILLQHGLKEGADYTVKPVGAGVYRFKAMAESKDNAAAILNLPFTVQAEQLGLQSLGRTVDLLGPYQARRRLRAAAPGRATNGAAAGALPRRLCRGAALGARPEQPRRSVALLVEKLKISPKEAERTYDLLIDPGFGFTPDAKFDPEGFKNMLALRAEIQRRPGDQAAARALCRPRLLRAGDEAAAVTPNCAEGPRSAGRIAP